MEFKFPSIDKYIKDDDIVITSNEKSSEYVNIPKLMGDYGKGVLGSLKMRKNVIHKMVGCMYNAFKSASSILKNPKIDKNIISENELANLEIFIKSLNIDKIGYTKATPDLVFKDHKILYGNVIVIIMAMDKEIMATAPSKNGLKEVFRTYYDLGTIVNKIALYLRQNGFNAMAGPAIGGDVSYVPLAEKAGLGAIGKHGLLITDGNLGPSLRIATIYTDIENLPFSEENPHLWIKGFCKKCGKCVKSCPAGAIYPNTLENGKAIDKAKCAVPFSNNFGCSVCIKSCTFFNGNYEKIKTGFEKV